MHQHGDAFCGPDAATCQHGRFDNIAVTTNLQPLLILIFIAPATVGKNLNPLLLQRAREISQEHKGLSQQLADAYDSQTAKRAGELAVVTAALEAWDRAKAVRPPL
jgi:hypothetical protein